MVVCGGKLDVSGVFTVETSFFSCPYYGASTSGLESEACMGYVVASGFGGDMYVSRVTTRSNTG